MTERIDLLSIILDALAAFEETIKRGDRDWASYPSEGDPEAVLHEYLDDIDRACTVIAALMPGPRLSPKMRKEIRKFLNEAERAGKPEPSVNMPSPKPRLDLDRANDGSAFIAVTYYDATGTPERTSVLSHAYGVVVDSVMKRKFEQMLELMAGHVTSDVTDAFKRPADNTDSVKSWTVRGTARQMGAIGEHETFAIEMDGVDADEATERARGYMADNGYEHVSVQTVSPASGEGPLPDPAGDTPGVYVKDGYPDVAVESEGTITQGTERFAQFASVADACLYLETLGWTRKPDHGNRVRQNGVDRCPCGCKYWENDCCIDCGGTEPEEDT